MMELKAAPGACEEASMLSYLSYVPCNKPAARMVKHGAKIYRMCAACADHNIRNRRGQDMGKFNDPA